MSATVSCTPTCAPPSTAATGALGTVDHDIVIDGVNATQRCVAVLFAAAYGDTTLRATGTYRDELIYERGGWYFTSRNLSWDVGAEPAPAVM